MVRFPIWLWVKGQVNPGLVASQSQAQACGRPRRSITHHRCWLSRASLISLASSSLCSLLNGLTYKMWKNVQWLKRAEVLFIYSRETVCRWSWKENLLEHLPSNFSDTITVIPMEDFQSSKNITFLQARKQDMQFHLESWCWPCSSMKKDIQKHHGEKVVFISISIFYFGEESDFVINKLHVRHTVVLTTLLNLFRFILSSGCTK